MADSLAAGPRRLVEVVDAPRTRVRRPGDLVGALLAAAGIVMVLLIAVFAHGTTEGVTQDVQSAVARILRGLVQIPLSLLQGIVALFLPWIVLVERLVHKAFRQVLEAIAASVLAAVTVTVAAWLLHEFGPESLVGSLTITTDGEGFIAMSPMVTALAAFLTASGSRDQRRTVAWSWNLYWVALVIAVITNEMTLPAALVTVLIGRAVGLATRYAFGVYNERAYGVALVEGIRRTGLDPVRVVRVGDIATAPEPEAVLASTNAPIGYTEHGLASGAGARLPGVGQPTDDGGQPSRAGHRDGDSSTHSPATDAATVIATSADPATLALERPGEGRTYTVTDASGERWDVVVLDGDRQVIGVIASLWASVRLRGFERRTVVSLRQAAERASLMSYAATAAQVRTPAFVGLAEVEDSVVLAYEHVKGVRALSELDPEEVSDDVLAEIWAQLRVAHAAGLAHRDLTADVLLVRDTDVWILGWATGDIATTELARRLDLAQMLALLAAHVGVERAVASAGKVLDPGLLGAITPLLQSVALPDRTRQLARQRKGLLDELRAALIERMPMAAEAEPVQLTRFSARTVMTTTIAVVAIWLVLSTLNIGQLSDALQQANPAWAAVAFGLGLLTYVGAALSFMAFSPVRLRLWRTTLVQVAASVVALVAPAGVGPAAVNLRHLNRRKVEMPLAVASVALMQISQFVTTVVLLLLIAALTGTTGTFQVPGSAALLVTVGLAVALGAALTIPAIRQRIWAKAGPTIQQVWPRVLWIVGQPARLFLGILGNVIMTGGFIASFAASVAAFGQEVPLTQLAIIYLGGMALGSALPTPGGLGTVELALSGGLTAAGIPAAVAASIAVVFRVLTFWGRVPLGWVAMRHLQRKNDL